MADKVVAVERTRQAIDAINAGDIQGGRALLAEALSIDPEYELAWLWFAAVAETDPEKKFCLEAARKVNPLHEANAALGPLRGIKPEPPEELRAIVDPDPPDFVQDYVPELVRQRRRRQLRWTGIVVAILGLLLGGLWLVSREGKTPVYIAVVVTSPTASASGDNSSRRSSTQSTGPSRSGTPPAAIPPTLLPSSTSMTTTTRRRPSRWRSRSPPMSASSR